MLCCCCRLPAEGDLYFTAKLQNYTAVEKDEAILSCELSKAAGEVKWFKDGNEIFPSKNVLLQSDGRKRLLVIKKTAKNNVGSYTCDCGTDKTTADLNIEGNPHGGPGRCPKSPVRTAESGPAHRRSSKPSCSSIAALRHLLLYFCYKHLRMIHHYTAEVVIMTETR